MNRNIALAYFDHEHDVLAATGELRHQGVEVLDVYSPHAIHGMDEALGLRPSRLTWVCFLCGAVGAIGAFWFQHWANAVSWGINVGGKPWNSMPAEAPVAFEMLVLLAAFGSVLACFAVCRLFPGKRSTDAVSRAMDDRYIVALPSASTTHGSETEELMRSLGAVAIEHAVQ